MVKDVPENHSTAYAVLSYAGTKKNISLKAMSCT